MNLNFNSAVVFVVVVLGIVFFAVTHDWHPLPPELRVCQAVIPRDYSTAIGFELKGKDVSLKLGNDSQTKLGATKETAAIIAAVADCVRGAKYQIIVDEGVYLSSEEALGAVANHWATRRGNLQLTFKSQTADEMSILNNLAIGPAAAASRAKLMRDWCAIEAACVQCNPLDPTDQTLGMSITLIEKPSIEKGVMAGNWPIPNTGTPQQPWELVDGKGTRTIYRCKAAPG